MGKRLITQRRGRGTSTYRAPSHRYYGKISYRAYDDTERNSVVYGTIQDLIDCPGHMAPLAEIKYDTKEVVLISAPLNVRVGDIVASGASAPVQTGNVLPLKNIPEGTAIYNLECRPGDGGKLVRTAGVFARVVGKVENGRIEKPFLKAGKRMHAMRARNKLYPQTSGVAMNAVDHPFGSGRGRHAGKPKTPPRWAPAGRNVGLIRARRSEKTINGT